MNEFENAWFNLREEIRKKKYLLDYYPHKYEDEAVQFDEIDRVCEITRTLIAMWKQIRSSTYPSEWIKLMDRRIVRLISYSVELSESYEQLQFKLWSVSEQSK
jgi:hypothetical protein